MLFTANRIHVRPLRDSDATLLVTWLSDPEVLRYYEGRDRPHDLAMVQKHFYGRSRDITPCIVEYDDTAIGYIQYYSLAEEERQEYGYEESEGRIFGMDQFIGATEYWNKGIGTELVQAMARHLTTEHHADKIVMDPQTWNERALKVYEKCGFHKVKLLPQHEYHEGEMRDCWLIEYKANQA
ncbi:acetyltransferase [Paenibacillus profundus]|uniref:Acetyltransferase n=1 Tax=Paenibacillus profundus TaxID=1173085 RepID=A0ABS8YKC6_9BACL|nr:GNAT family N-acetyltransferase [Paenibacillus profundus]MCE5171627.1 acetyltransferase [Paenibacillus profundus]